MAIEVEWARMTAPELKRLAAERDALAILPVGSLEQHGPHLPVITDTASAGAAAIRAARLVAEDPRAPVPVAVLPGLWLGMSEHHLPFGGTITVDYRAYFGILEGVVRSLKSLGFARLLIVNGHGGNVDPLAVAVRELAVAHDLPIVATTPWFLNAGEIAAIFESDTMPRHACEGETSVMMAIAPDIVRTGKLDEAMQQAPAPVHAPPGFSRFYSFAERAPVTGTWGDPRSATAEKGERFLAVQASALADAIRDKTLWTRPDPVWRAGRGQGTASGRVE
ncbi:MAG: creatininase family protein [Bradyrhizobium sp.]|uniref:creatininase family protein n=1 Tax=Bradyrhizobium sp. TaxID=376 RepID=UPI001D75B4F8|nr:creatininase family protein [Bradyrhizobium sp.]MBV9563955.1 creatininase family protein [Bradyrhizobium sp.]